MALGSRELPRPWALQLGQAVVQLRFDPPVTSLGVESWTVFQGDPAALPQHNAVCVRGLVLYETGYLCLDLEAWVVTARSGAGNFTEVRREMLKSEVSKSKKGAGEDGALVRSTVRL